MKTATRGALRIIGVDPGLVRTGWCVLNCAARTVQVADSGVIATTTAMAFPDRLVKIYDELEKIIARFSPDVLAVEEVIFAENVRVALKLGHARGAVLIVAAKHHLPAISYAPKKIKESITGNGNASKFQVQRMVQSILGLADLPSPHDVADAMAVALCHFHRYSVDERLR